MKMPGIKYTSALFLQAAIVLIGIGALGFMLWEPHLEGRNVHATTFEIYFKDPFLAYVYVGSIPFFVALHRAFGLLGHIRRNGTFSQMTVNALRSIKRCGIVMLGFVAGGAIFVIVQGDGEDRPAGLFMCMLVAFVAGVIATTAAMFARNVQGALSRGEGRPA
jgi:hypothetical protein